jgi:archaemetzincin
MAISFSDVLLIPFGETPLAPVHEAADDLARIIGLSARVSPERMGVPDDSYDVRRGQFQAPRLLQRLRAARTGPDGWIRRGSTLLLGVATVDLYAPGLSFVFGQADTVGGVAVISLTRLYPAFYARNHDMESFRRRSAIEAVHEVGHLLGVHHCEDRHCVMFYSSTITDSDRKGPLFCSGCRSIADRSVTPATAASVLPSQPAAS